MSVFEKLIGDLAYEHIQERDKRYPFVKTTKCSRCGHKCHTISQNDIHYVPKFRSPFTSKPLCYTCIKEVFSWVCDICSRFSDGYDDSWVEIKGRMFCDNCVEKLADRLVDKLEELSR
jgi:hypothetical protein